ncbi:MAG: DUF86 domain-containing protein [Ignavibacteria bacterium]|nr:DUF86 domain-containing protein [Ignavibacteria bacterium]
MKETISKTDSSIRNSKFIDARRNAPSVWGGFVGWARSQGAIRMKMIALRNLAIHEYFGVDPEILWTIITRDLPQTKEKIKQLIDTDLSPLDS